jgi:hypothetical protein
MHLRNTLILVGVALTLGLFIFVFERHTPSTDELALRERLAFPAFKDRAKHADAIEIARGESKIVLVRREAGTIEEHWRITQPLDCHADASRVISILGAFERAERILLGEGVRSKKLAPAQDLAEYGLGHEHAVRVRAMAGEETLLDALIGNATVVAEQTYAAPGDRTEVFAVAKDLRESVSMRVDELRDKRMLHLTRGKLASIAVLENEQPSFEIARSVGNEWRLVAPIADRADRQRAEKIADRVGSLWADAFKEDFAADGADMLQKLAKWGLRPAARSVRVTRTINDELRRDEVLFGKRVKKTMKGEESSWAVYAMVAGSRSVVFVPEGSLDVFSVSSDDMRDRHAFRFEPAAATAVTIKRSADEVKLEKRPDGWKVISHKELAADGERVGELLGDLLEIRAQQFLPFDTELVDPYAVTVTVDAGGGRAAESLYVEPAGRGDDQALRARRGERGSAFTLPASVRAALDVEALQLRDRRVLTFDANRLAGLAVHRGAKVTRATRADNVWRLEGGGEVDTQNADTMKWELSGLVAARLVAEGADLDLTPYGLDAPSVKVELKLRAAGDRGEETFRLMIGGAEDGSADAKRFYVTIEGTGLVFLVSEAIVQKLGKPLARATDAAAGED